MKKAKTNHDDDEIRKHKIRPHRTCSRALTGLDNFLYASFSWSRNFLMFSTMVSMLMYT